MPAIDQNGNTFPLPSGDFVVQTVVTPSGEAVRIKSEIVEVLDVGVVEGDAAFAGPGLTASGTDGGELATVRVRVASISGTDSAGNAVRMRSSADPAGGDCRVLTRYYEFIRYSGSAGAGEISDAGRRSEFITIDPDPASPTTNFIRTEVSPFAGFSMRFSEPMDLDRISTLDNFVLTQEEATLAQFQTVLSQPKSASLLFLASRLVDVSQNATLLRLDAPLGAFHVQGQTERYWFHVDLSDNGVADLAGNVLDIYDERPAGSTTIGGESVDVPLANFSQEFEMASSAQDNLVASRVFRFADADEDGTKPGSIDFFGQFLISGGTLSGAAVSRKSRTADNVNLTNVPRWNRGECVDTSVNPPVSVPPGGGFGNLYLTPSMIATQATPPLVFQPPQGPQNFGGIVEPHTSRGARMQMTYREDDFALGYKSTDELNIDVEQLYWAPWNDGTVLFDTFDRYTMKLGHARKRPDMNFVWDPMNMVCLLDCFSMASGLSNAFADNPLRGTDFMKPVVQDKQYVINPNDAFRAASGVKYVPYPAFDDTYTWRDSRLLTWDQDSDQAVGLGGAVDTRGVPPNLDTTASVSSPWITDAPPANLIAPVYVRDPGDFLGDRDHDYDPIGLPLLVDISVWPDDTRQVANAGNLFHIAYVGPIWPGGANGNGYYNAVGICAGVPNWPVLRVYSFGGPDPNDPGQITYVTPDREMVARGGVAKDMGFGDGVLGLFQTPPGDDHLHWAQIDLVRRVSYVTAGFFDTLMPNQHGLTSTTNPFPAPLPPANGRPDFSAVNGGNLAIADVQTLMDPPVAVQPGGTSVLVELRGAGSFDQATLYDQQANDGMATRGNLLNPNYACEAYRYASPNGGPGATATMTPDVRVAASGLTPYVDLDHIDSIRDPLTNLLPRYMNFRLVLRNNIDSNPAGVPILRSFALVYRVAPN